MVLVFVALACAIALGLWLRAAAFRIGYTFDDYGHLAARHEAFPVHRGAWNLYAYVFDRPAEHEALRAAGNLPWWSHPNVQFAMLRPLASLLIAFDDAAAPIDARFAHLHSAFWWCAMLVAFALALARRVDAAVVAVGLFVVALAESNTLALAWIANRTALVSLTFGLVALSFHQLAAESLRKRDSVATAIAWTLALAGGEYAIGLTAYFVTLEASARGPGRARRLAVIAIPLALYALAHRLGGYGTRGSGAYIDPVHEWPRFAHAFPARFGELLLNAYGGVSIERIELLAAPPWRVLAAGLAVAVVVIALAWWSLASSETTARRTTRAWIAAGPLALIPMTGGYPSPRLSITASIAVAIAVGSIVIGALRAIRGVRTRSIGARVVLPLASLALLLVHAGIVPIRTRSELATTLRLGGAGTRSILASPARHEMHRDTRALVLAAADPSTLFYAPTMWHLMSRGEVPMPRSWWVVSMVLGAQVLVRTAPDTLEIRAIYSDMIIGPFEQLFRDAALPMHEGETFVAGELTVTIRAMGRLGPRALQLRYAPGWDSPDIVVILPTARGLVRIPVPAVGAGFPIPPAGVPLEVAE